MPRKKLSHRLQYFHTIANAYPVVWDLCCDHGMLGLSLVGDRFESIEKESRQIRLVDQVPEICQKLSLRIQCPPYSSKARENIEVICESILKIPASEYKRGLVCATGVGGHLMTRFIAWLDQTGAKNLKETHFLLSPHRNLELVEAQLKSLNWGILLKDWIEDKGHRYPVLLVHPGALRESYLRT